MWRFLEALSDRAVERGEITPAERYTLQSFVTTLLWGISAVSCYDPAAVDSAVDAANWSIDARFPPDQA